jgi:hypothetical protein
VATGRAKRDSTTRSAENFSPYAIALDTRYLNTEVGKDDHDDFQQEVIHFLQTTFRRRGFSPSVFTWTECCNGIATALSNDDPDPGISSGATDCKPTNKHPTTTRKDIGRRTSNRSGKRSSRNNSNITIVSKSLKDDHLDEILSNVNGSPIRPPRSEENTKNRMVTCLPKELMAKSTWDVFGNLGTYQSYFFRYTLSCNLKVKYCLCCIITQETNRNITCHKPFAHSLRSSSRSYHRPRKSFRCSTGIQGTTQSCDIYKRHINSFGHKHRESHSWY